MDRQDIYNSAALTFPTALLLGLISLPLMGWEWSLCMVLSAFWGATNLWALGLVLDAIVLQRSVMRGLLAVQIKLVTLFGGLFLLVGLPVFNIWAFLVGFHVIFAVALVKNLIGCRAGERSACS